MVTTDPTPQVPALPTNRVRRLVGPIQPQEVGKLGLSESSNSFTSVAQQSLQTAKLLYVLSRKAQGSRTLGKFPSSGIGGIGLLFNQLDQRRKGGHPRSGQ